MEAVRGGGQEGSKPRERLSREWGALVAPTEAHCTEGHMPAEGEGCRGSVPGEMCGEEGPGPTRGESGGPGEAGVRERGSGGQREAARVHAGTPGARGRRASTAGYRGQVRPREGREAVGRDGGAGRAPRESSDRKSVV